MARRPVKKPLIETLVSFWIPSLTFVTGIGFFAFHFAAGVADKPYVDGRFNESIKYTDDRMKYAIEAAVAHSDANRQAMMLKIEEMNSDRQKNEASLAAKVDIILNTIQNNQSRKSSSH